MGIIMTIAELGLSMGIEAQNETHSDITVLFSNGVEMERQGSGVWTYDNDGRTGISMDPKLAVEGAEGLSRGRTIFDGEAYIRMQNLYVKEANDA